MRQGFFRTLLMGQFKESDMTEIEIGACTGTFRFGDSPFPLTFAFCFSAQQFAAVHFFFYNGRLPKNLDLVLVSSLIPLAQYLQFEALKLGVEQFFQTLADVDESSLCQTWALAEQSKMLQNVCIDFLVEVN
jgi:hypothetical protein